ncbi:DUF2254 domain-containing protein [Jejudonia soesokkakensis]|uniref:DUF2254 domain-containing protein n=1 Tax=Jejudonia soesokkakensis TaxID=1323432 RepID=A0ABW2MWD4_9FLAO
MKKIYNRIRTFFNVIESKIAFYPSLLAFVGFNLAFIMVYFEKGGISKKILENFPQLMLEDGDTALTIISACIGGLISMMVFSFSMVMLLLSQASSNFSPRLLPGLISDKKNQVILGTYLASILYMIFTLFSIEPEDKKYSLPGLSIIIGILLTIICLAAFIYFIHNMSQSIQISNILDNIFEKSKERLDYIINKEKEIDIKNNLHFPGHTNWNHYTTNKSGYFQNISLQNVINFCKKYDVHIYIAIPKGFFVLQHASFIYSDKKLDDDMRKELFSNFNFSRGELVEDNYILAFKQITEIAVKAMSPGINDPGTCINAVDYLTELFALRIQKSDSGVIVSEGETRIKIAIVPFADLLYNVMASLRTYCKHDPIIVQKMVWMLSYLKDREVFSEDYTKAIENELKILLSEAKTAFDSTVDTEYIKDFSKKI